MNTFTITGRVVEVGQPRSERAPTPIVIECKGGKEPDYVPMEVWGSVCEGEEMFFTGKMTSREYQGKRYLSLQVFAKGVIPQKDDNQQQQAPPPRQQYPQQQRYPQSDNPPPQQSQHQQQKADGYQQQNTQEDDAPPF